MNSKTTLSLSEARKNIFEISNDVQKPGHYYTFTENGRPKAVLMSADEFDSLMENLELLSNPEAMVRIARAEEEFDKGEFSSWSEVKKELGLNGLQSLRLAERPKRIYGKKAKAKKK
jgi:prevent-host-death family protein